MRMKLGIVTYPALASSLVLILPRLNIEVGTCKQTCADRPSGDGPAIYDIAGTAR